MLVSKILLKIIYRAPVLEIFYFSCYGERVYGTVSPLCDELYPILFTLMYSYLIQVTFLITSYQSNIFS